MRKVLPLVHRDGCQLNSQTDPTPILAETGVVVEKEHGAKTVSTELGVNGTPFA